MRGGLRWAPAALLAAIRLGRAPDASADDSVRACIAASTEGQTLRQDGHLLGAREQLIACARDACPGIVRAHCARWLAELEPRIPSVVVRAQDAAGSDLIGGATLTIDGAAHALDGHPVQLDPGAHVLLVQTESGARQEEKVLLVEGEASRLVTLRISAPGPAVGTATAGSTRTEPTGSTRVPAGAWILGGAGLVALGGATYFALAASSDLNQLKSTCSPHCSDAQTQPGRTDAALFDVLLGVGGAALGAAFVWALAFPSARDEGAARVGFDVTPVPRGAAAGLTLRF